MKSARIEVVPPLTRVLQFGSHFFSTLIFRQEGGVETYYELGATYHGLYPSMRPFRIWWQTYIRPTRKAETAIRYRVEAVLKRSGTTVIRFRYIATVKMPAISIHLSSRVAMRHITAVTISAEAFALLHSRGLLREVPQGDTTTTLAEKHRQIIFGLLPIQNRQTA